MFTRKSILNQITRTLALLCMFLSVPALAANHALLIGVAKYPKLDEQLQLDGPIDDVRLMREVLIKRGFDDSQIQTLSDDSATLPTRSNILAAFERLIDKTNADDFVYLHFAGHGSQQPVMAASEDNRERDGLDEIFLPRDVGGWNGTKGSVENALTDNEIASLVTRIRDKGAFVWVVMDNCHSGGAATRSLTRMRKVTGEQLGIPAELMTSVQVPSRRRGGKQAEQRLGVQPARGGMVAFYAAQPHQQTPEMRLPFGSDDAKYRGIFTYSLVTSMERFPNASYRQLAQEIQNNFQQLNWYSSTPLFEGGEYLDRIPFSEQKSEAERASISFEENTLSIQFGQIHGVSDGAILAVYPSIAAPESDILGYVQVSEAGPLTSTVRSVEHNGMAAYSDWLSVDNPVVEKRQAGLDLNISVYDATQVYQPMLQEMANINWVADRADAQFVLEQDLAVNPQHLYLYNAFDAASVADLEALLNQGGEVEFWRPFLVKTHQGPMRLNKQRVASSLQTALEQLVKVQSLLSLSYELSTGLGQNVQLQVSRTSSAGESSELLPNSAIYPGDKLQVTMLNEGSEAVDVTLLFVGADLSISQVFPTGVINNRVYAKQQGQVTLNVNDSSVGPEFLVMIVEPAREGASNSYGFLTQQGLDSSSLRGDSQGMHRTLQQLNKGMRGATVDYGGQQGPSMQVFGVKTQGKQ